MRILEADHHRNGVGGEPFYVALVDHMDRHYLLTWFPEYGNDDQTLLPHQTRVAVIDVFEATTGNVYMHPTGTHDGGNAWRGADHFAPILTEIVRIVDAQNEAMLQSMRDLAKGA